MNILLDKTDFNEAWAYDTFKNIIKPEHRICVIPFAFDETWIKDEQQWQETYNKVDGQYYKGAIDAFYAYGIKDHNITLIDYFMDTTESDKEKIYISDIIFFTGGFPDKIIDRLLEFDLINTIEQYEGIIMGWSAGAMIQCFDYYISPDEDYDEFVHKKGLRCIEDFAVEVHYKNIEVQNRSIEKYMLEKSKKVYTIEAQSAIIADGKKIILLGNAKAYRL